MKPIFRSWFRKFKSRVERRLDKTHHSDSSRPAFSASNIDYEVSQRDHAIAYGGIGAIHALVGPLGLAGAIDLTCMCSRSTCPITSPTTS